MAENIRRVIIESVSDRLGSKVIYSPENFGLPLISQTGKNVKICLLDSGVANHTGIKNIKESVNFTKHKDHDAIGHATFMAGAILCNDDNLLGIAPDAQLYCAKIVDDTCRVRFDSIIAGILWAVIKKVDILLIPISTNIEHTSLSTAINKAVDSGICVIASVGNQNVIEYPAKYKNVLSVGSLDLTNNLASFSSKGDFNIAGTMLETTYKDSKYAVVSGTSISAALAAGMCARLIEKLRTENIQYSTEMIYAKMKELSVKIK